ncbi:MAG: laccase domain-containing protein [Coriobacteriia bacterium]|nr:laccase domain-containing protein [Coriobacteriia bacterium]
MSVIAEEPSVRGVRGAQPVSLVRETAGGLAFLHDPALREAGVLVAFSERTGGVSTPPYDSLNLAAHTGDDPEEVDENRRLLLIALGLGGATGLLSTAEQVHGELVVEVTPALAGSGARAAAGRPPVPGADALLTLEHGVPLMLHYADCVPVVLVALSPVRAVAVAHAGWRGALAGLPGAAARALAQRAGTAPGELRAYVGPRIGVEDYEVSSGLAGAFGERFGPSVVRGRRVDLGEAALASLAEAGVDVAAAAVVPGSTASETDRFFSYRADGVTGRHAAVAALRGGL